MKKEKPSDYALGVMVTERNLHAVLVKRTSDGPRLVRQFIRQRNIRATALQPGLAAAVPELQEESTSDFTISFGDGSSNSNDLFLASEFGAEGRTGEAGENGVSNGSSFEIELSELIEECEKAGFPDPQVGLCLGSADLTQITLQLTEVKAGKGKKQPKGKESRLAALTEHYHGDVDRERVAFLPMMSADNGEERCLAIAGRHNDGIGATIEQFAEQKDQRMPAFRLLDAEASLLLALARATTRSKNSASETEHALVLRPGAEDTLVMFLTGGQLQHCESMRSLNAFDSPETICSRILLQQDEFGFGDISYIIVLSDEREQDLIGSLEMFFPEARVVSMRSVMAAVCGTEGAAIRSASCVSAAAVAVRLTGGAPQGVSFEQVNLLPRRIARRRIRVPFNLQQVIIIGLLFVTAFFFTTRYIIQSAEISERQEQLAKYPPELRQGDPRALQARIDSMKTVYTGYMRALDVLDSLLVGSDQWSRGLERVTRASASARGGWVEKWTPKDGKLELQGNATTRDQVVRLGNLLEGDIQALTFSEIREFPVYSYTMVIPMKQELPEAAEYLRDQAAARLANRNPQNTVAKAPASGNANARRGR